jgi:hypothetical protein
MGRERVRGEGEREGGRVEGRIEYIWHTTYVGRHVSCLEELNEVNSMDEMHLRKW